MATTIIISWGLPEEELFAAVKGVRPINLKPLKVIPDSALVGNASGPEAASVDEVYVCGTYFNDLKPVINGCPNARITALVYSEADLAARKYGDVCDYRLLRPEIPTAAHPWMRRILRRTELGAPIEDEQFYRGVIHGKHSVSLFDKITQMREEKVDEAALIRTGAIILDHIEAMAEFVASTGRLIKIGGQECFVAVGSWSPVLPIVQVLARRAKIGVLIRYNLDRQTTHFTFYSHEGADMSFVRQPPFNGGGDPHCMGATVAGVGHPL